MSSRKILVTGGAGFIGSHLVDGLIEKGHDVRILDNLDPQVHGKEKKNPDYLNPKAEFIKGDVRDKNTLKTALEGIDIVFHEAAAVGIGQSMYQIDYYVDVNCRGTGLLLEEIVSGNYPIKKMIVASSMSIYGEGIYDCPECGKINPGFRPKKQLEAHQWEMKCEKCKSDTKPIATNEEKPIKPTSVYAVTKRDQEELVLSVGKAYGIPAVALRYFNAYGPRQSLSNPYTGVAAIFQSNLKNNNPPVVYEEGLQSRDFIDIKDIVCANLLVMENESANYDYFNVGSGTPTTILEVAKVLAKLYKKDLTPNIQNKFRQGDIRHCFADISKIRKIGFEPQISFEEGMKTLVEWGEKQNAVDQTKKALDELKQRNLIEK